MVFLPLHQEKLSKKFKVDGIPTLVILDGKDGKVIVANGRTKVAEDQQAKDFPWRPKGLADVMKDVKLVNHEKEEKSFADLAGKVLGLYFSAHWVCNDWCMYMYIKHTMRVAYVSWAKRVPKPATCIHYLTMTKSREDITNFYTGSWKPILL